MKKSILIYFLSLCGIFFIQGVFAQLSIPASGLTIKSGVSFSVDSLAFIPSADFTMTSVNIQKTNVPIGGTSGGSSINQVYNFNSILNYSGTVRMYYNPSGLNSNTESMLQFATTPSWLWTTTTASTVNTTAHYVEKGFTGLSLQKITATEQGITLPLVANSLTARLYNGYVDVQWQVDQNNLYSGFALESSQDGSQWKQITFVPADQAFSAFTYNYTDRAINFSRKQYRIKLQENNGRSSYSYVVSVKKENQSTVTIKTEHAKATIYFSGSQPDGISIYDMKGVLLQRNRSGLPQYDVKNLLPGVYVLSYKLEGESFSKQFMIME